mgnify:CR=1 FL=1
MIQEIEIFMSWNEMKKKSFATQCAAIVIDVVWCDGMGNDDDDDDGKKTKRWYWRGKRKGKDLKWILFFFVLGMQNHLF